MDINVAKKRRSQVIMVDSINSTEYDFLATHIPFRKIAFRYGVGNSLLENVDEQTAFYKLFKDPAVSNKHQLIIVEGSSGSGKSHFIRWLNANLKSDNSTDEILLIRRSDNTLKGTIKQLLSIDAVQNLKNKDIYERLVRANSAISEKKFKDKIYHEFIVEIENSDDEFLTTLERKRLCALLSDLSFKEKLLSKNGPIERIFSKISASTIQRSDVVAQFEAEDFIIDIDLFNYIHDTGSHDARRIAKNLTNDENLDDDLVSRIVTCINKKVDSVIQSCAGIEPGDFEQIFKDIRKELFKVGKNLVLLVEDITSFTGINTALLNTLIIEHTGLNANDNMCKLISVIGTTSEYYKQFRDNYKDRITSQITIADGTIGEKQEDLYLFFGKYLNAISIDEETMKDWYINNGAAPEKMPIYVDNKGWDTVDGLSLYPFTKRAIVNLYNNMDEHKTPRYILREIIEPIVNELLNDNNKLFYYFRNRRTGLNDNQKARISNTIDELGLSSDEKEIYKNRAICFIGFWGNGDISKKGKKIAGIDKAIYDEFGFSNLYDKLFLTVGDNVVDSDDVVIEPQISNNMSSKPKENKKYNDFKKQLDGWYEKKEIFINPRDLLDELNKVIVGAVNWQQYGVSKQIISMVDESSSFKLLSFERQEKNEDSSVYKLPASKESYELLRAIGQWRYIGNKTWHFDEAIDATYTVTSWIEKNKMLLINNLLQLEQAKTPLYIKISIVNEIYRKILNNELDVNKIDAITVSDLINVSKNIRNEYYSDKWQELKQFMHDSNGEISRKVLIDYFNISQGTGIKKVFLNYVPFEKALKDVKNDLYNYDINQLDKSTYTTVNNIYKMYSDFKKRIGIVIEKQNEIKKSLVDNLYNIIGWGKEFDIEVSDLKNLFTDISNFYSKCEQTNQLFENQSNKIEKLKLMVSDIVKNLFNLKKIDDGSGIVTLYKYSKIEFGLLNEVVKLISAVEYTVDSIEPIIDNEYEKLIKSGKVIEKDPRFEQKRELFELCKNEMEAL